MDPLFVSSRTVLLSRLRLSGTSAYEDAAALIDEALNIARVRFYDCLGETRITDLLAIEPQEAPTTTDGVLRLKAASCEIALVRMHLLRTMPTLFQDGSDNVTELWNEEGLVRRKSAFEITGEIKRLETEVAAWIEELQGEPHECSQVAVSVIEPEQTPARPGGTVWG